MTAALLRRWPEYLMEAAALGLFMVAACLCCAALEHPLSPLHRALPDATVRRVLMGLAMGLTAAGLIYSPMGKRSGAHMNPAVTLIFWYLGKVTRWDAIFYMLFQLVGGLAGVGLSALVLGGHLADPALNWVVTVPGPQGPLVACLAEAAIAFLMMFTVLEVSNHRDLAPYTGCFAGVLVALFVIVESPFSGFGMNPARTLASAIPAHQYTALWLYLIAPPLGMWAAAEAYLALRGAESIFCAKLHHHHLDCHFVCGHQPAEQTGLTLQDWQDAAF